ncbi:hypothetical protein DH2020_030561 [Rehmannia glutinosa]|uniref:Protein kinase domain-containing protein n=1 Tax=Rehmannia glutinosa TaxID=99300 RepID=A0ABR0VKH0_REHGL
MGERLLQPWLVPRQMLPSMFMGAPPWSTARCPDIRLVTLKMRYVALLDDADRDRFIQTDSHSDCGTLACMYAERCWDFSLLSMVTFCILGQILTYEDYILVMLSHIPNHDTRVQMRATVERSGDMLTRVLMALTTICTKCHHNFPWPSRWASAPQATSKPNPYARKDAPEYSEPPQTTPRPKTPGRRSFPPPSPANLLTQLNKNFGFSAKFASRFDFEEEEEQGEFWLYLFRHCQEGGGKYSEDYAKAIIIQILNVRVFAISKVSFHRLEQKLNDVVGSAYYVAPEVIQKSYSTEADDGSIVLKDNPSFNENPWPSLSSESKDFVRRLLHKDPSRRITAAQALCHPWLQNHDKAKLTLDVLVFRLMKGYMRSSSLRKAALRELGLRPTVPVHAVLQEWIRPSDGKLTFRFCETVAHATQPPSAKIQ